ncbi:hypothetical protein Patl1_04630 [Pistacia atlantica]|uniref:Uncharacterized protein n=1 Tax=Pistacia atlantica TaxID=434234 RepID=A0ACC1BT63_9ROSI|nr:hypothetical protein Patl1_04630 [Pistacia atlantica]
MVSAPFVSFPTDVSLPFAFFTAPCVMIIILICVLAICIIAATFITLITYIVCECICSPFIERYERRDIEPGRRGNHRARIRTYQTIDIPADHNYRSIDVIEGIPSSIEERRILRQQALEKLLPPVVYRSKEIRLGINSGECSICLDDYTDGETCRVFPACKHMFHSICIDGWLKNHLTCPVCRKCLLDA